MWCITCYVQKCKYVLLGMSHNHIFFSFSMYARACTVHTSNKNTLFMFGTVAALGADYVLFKVWTHMLQQDHTSQFKESSFSILPEPNHRIKDGTFSHQHSWLCEWPAAVWRYWKLNEQLNKIKDNGLISEELFINCNWQKGTVKKKCFSLHSMVTFVLLFHLKAAQCWQCTGSCITWV